MALELLRVVAMLIGRAVNLERKDIVAAPMRYKYVAILFSVIRQTIVFSTIILVQFCKVYMYVTGQNKIQGSKFFNLG